MIKLNCGVSRKVGEPNFGSRGASVNLEMELDSAAVGNAQLLHEKMKRLFGLAKAAVDEELGVAAADPPGRSQPPEPEAPKKAGVTAPDQPKVPVRKATQAQIAAIGRLCQKLGVDPEQQVRKRFGCGVAELALPDASALIDELKAGGR